MLDLSKYWSWQRHLHEESWKAEQERCWSKATPEIMHWEASHHVYEAKWRDSSSLSSQLLYPEENFSVIAQASLVHPVLKVSSQYLCPIEDIPDNDFQTEVVKVKSAEEMDILFPT